MKKFKRIKLKNIDLIAYDFDGVMTDNKVLVFEDGKEAVFCNRSDGLAISMIKQMKVPQIILSTEKNMIVGVRAKKLKIKVFQGIDDKRACLVNYCKKMKYSLKKVIYIGNDINDLNVMKVVGYSAAPLDADVKIRNISKLVLKVKGGEGVVKSFFDEILGV